MDSKAASSNTAEPVAQLQIGNPSSFGKNNWWSPSDYHKISPDGFGSDIACEAGTVGELAVAGVSVRGHKHRVDGGPNEDSFAIRVATSGDKTDYAVLVLCDGLSSAKHSSFAARRTSALVADMLRHVIADEAFNFERLKLHLGVLLRDFVVPELLNWPQPSPDNLLALPAYGYPVVPRDQVSVADLLVTLTIAIVPTTNGTKGASKVLLATIGDSPCLILTKKGEWVRPDYNETDDGVLTTATAAFPKITEVAVSEVVLYEGDCLCLMSDGVGNFVLNKNQPLLLGKHLAELWRTPRDIPTLIRDISFDLRSADDDRTVILCWTDREFGDVAQPQGINLE